MMKQQNYLNKISSFININKLSIIIIIIFVISCISGSIIYTGIKKSSNEKASFVLYELIDIIKNGSDKTTSLKEIENRYSTLKEKIFIIIVSKNGWHYICLLFVWFRKIHRIIWDIWTFNKKFWKGFLVWKNSNQWGWVFYK